MIVTLLFDILAEMLDFTLPARRLVTLLAFNIALTATSVVSAEQRNEEQALVLYNRAEERFLAEEYESAALLLREALVLLDAAPLHFNLARALQELDDLEGAREHYARFLELDSDTPRREEIEGRIAEIDARLEARAVEAEAAAAEAAAAEAALALSVEPVPVERRGRARSGALAPWIVMGSSILPLGVAIVCGALFGREVEDARNAGDHRTAADHVSQADTLALVTNISYVTAGVVGLAGLVWGLIDVLTRREERNDALLLTPLGIAGQF